MELLLDVAIESHGADTLDVAGTCPERHSIQCMGDGPIVVWNACRVRSDDKKRDTCKADEVLH